MVIFFLFLGDGNIILYYFGLERENESENGKELTSGLDMFGEKKFYTEKPVSTNYHNLLISV